MNLYKDFYKKLTPVKRYVVVCLLFFVLLILNNCGGGGGSSNNASVLDLMSSNDVEVTTLNSQTSMLLGNVFVSIAEVGKEQVILKSANTGDSGVYVFPKIKIGSYVISCSKPGYEIATANVVVTDGPQKIKVSLKPSYPADSISGVVKRSDTLAGIPDVTVEIKDSSPIIKAISDKDGNYVLNSVQPTSASSSPYTLKASKAGFATTEKSNVTKISNIALKNVDIIMPPSGSSEILLPGRIIGVVKSSTTGLPIENIKIELQDSNVAGDFSRSTGYYHLDTVPAGKTYYLTAIETTTTKSYKPYSLSVTLTSEQTLVQDILMEPVTPAAAPDYGYLVGTVLDDVSKNAISGATVEILGTSLYKLTDANGSFKISTITPDTEYIVLFSKSGYVSQTLKQKIVKNENNLDPIYLKPTSSTQNYCSVVGIIKDADTKIVTSGVTVELLVPDTTSVGFNKLTTTSGAGGEFAFTNIFISNERITGQPMTMTLSRSDYVSKTMQITAVGGTVNQIAESQTEMTKLKGNIMGSIIDADTNQGIPGANVTIANFTYPQIPNPVTSAAGTGGFSFSNIPVGTYTIIISAADYATEIKNGITISTNGQTVSLTIQLKKDYGTLSGYVYLETNNTPGFQVGAGGDTPISGITVEAKSSSGTSVLTSDISKSDGSYSLKNLPLSFITVSANGNTTSNANYTSYFTNYTVTKGYQNLNMELSPTRGTISGKIYEDVNRDGSFNNEPAVPNAAVTVTQSGSTITATTDAQGNYVMTGLSFGSITLTASKSNYNSASRTVTLPQNANLSNIDIGVYRPTGKLAGRVIDSVTKQGVSGITVKVLGFSDLTTVTSSTGDYNFDNVTASTGGVSKYTIVADGSTIGYSVVTADTDAPAESAVINVTPIEVTKITRLIYGKIVDSVTNAGVEGVQVQIQGTSITPQVTSASGTYIFDAVPVGTYNLNISDTTAKNINGSPRYQSRDMQITVSNDSIPLKVSDISVTPNLGKIRGTVYDSLTGYPIKSTLFTEPIKASVTIPGLAAPVETNVSSTNGEFIIENIPQMGSYNYTVRIYHSTANANQKMFEEVSKTTVVNAGQISDMGIIYVALKTVTIKGYVKDSVDSSFKVAGATITATIKDIAWAGKTATANYNGYYQITVPAYSNYLFTVNATNYSNLEIDSQSVILQSSHSQDFDLTPTLGKIQGVAYIDVNNNGYYDAGDTKIDESLSSSGKKYDPELFQVRVKYKNVYYSAYVKLDSSFEFNNVPIGDYYLTMVPPAATGSTPQYSELNTTTFIDGISNSRIISVATSSTTPSPVNAVVTRTQHSTGRIFGTIVDSTTLNGIANVEVSIAAKNITTYTDSSGNFSITNLNYWTNDSDTSEVYKLDIKGPGYINIERTYTLSDYAVGSNSVEIYEKLSKGAGTITGTVTDSGSGSQIANVNVTLTGTNITPQITQTDTNGNYSFTNIAIGTYDLKFSLTDYSSYTLNGAALTQNGQTLIKNVSISKNFGSVTGTIYLETNNVTGYQSGQDKPLSDITVTATGPSEITTPQTYTATTLSDGKYTLNNLPYGTYSLTFSTTAAEQYNASPVTINISGSTKNIQKDVEMKAKTGSLYGVIFDDANNNGIKDGAESVISNITITPDTVFGASVAAFTTGSDGTYRFNNMLPVNGKITIANGTNVKSYQTKVIYQTITSGVSTELNIPMSKNTFSIYGKIIDKDTSSAIQNVNVSINGLSISTVTGSDGKFTLANVPLNSTGTTTYNIFCEAISLGYQTEITQQTKASSDFTDIVFSKDIELSKSVRKVTGKVVNSGDAKGISGANLVMIGNSSITSTTDSFGNFTLDNVPVDLVNPIELQVTANEYEIKIVNFNLGVGTTTYKISPDIQLTSSLGKVTGKVIDSLTGGPVSSLNFTVSAGITEGNVSKSAVVKNDGTFTVTDVPKGGPYSLTIRSSAGANQYFNDVVTSVNVNAGQTTDVGTLYVALKTVKVFGTVYDSKVYPMAVNAGNDSRAGISDAMVTAVFKKYDGSNYTVTANTSSSGSFEIELPALTFDFTASKANFVSQSIYNKNINSYPADFTGLDFKVKPVVNVVYGAVYLDEGNPPNGYVDDATEKLLHIAQSGIFSSIVSSGLINVSYTYKNFTFGATVQNDSSFLVSDVPVGTYTMTVYDSGTSPKIMTNVWIDPLNPTNRSVIVNSNSVSPTSVKIAVSPSTSQYAGFSGQVYDDKIWTEGYNLYNTNAAYNRANTNYQVPNATITIRSEGGYTKVVTTDAEGKFFFTVPGNQRYTMSYTASGYIDTSESQVVADSGQTYQNREVRMYPKYGKLSGTIYYDNNVNGPQDDPSNPNMRNPYKNNNDPTDYNHIPDAGEMQINKISGDFAHPTRDSNWSGITINVTYSYRGLTFGTTTFDKSNSVYTIERVPVGSYQLLARDVSSLSNWANIGYQHNSSKFMDQKYTVDGMNPANVLITENTETQNINFAMMVWGGHLVGRRYLTSGGTTPDFTPGNLDKRTGVTVSAPIRGYNYWQLMGGNLNQISGMNIPRKYYIEIVELGFKIPFSDALGLIDIKSYPVGNNPDIIIPPGTYTLAIAGDIDLSSGPIPVNAMGPNGDVGMNWFTSTTGIYYKYGETEATADDRCLNTINIYRGSTTGATGVVVAPGQNAVIQ